MSEAAQNTALSISVKPAGGEGCAANPRADGGRLVISEYQSGEHAPSYGDSTNYTFQTAGSYLICGWLVEPGVHETVVASQSATVSVRQPHLALSISAPKQVTVGQTFQVSITAQAETTRGLFVYVLPPTGDGCPANAQAASDSAEVKIVVSSIDITGGPAVETRNELLNAAGIYMICGYIEYGNPESPPELAANTTVAVVEPPPPCVVPTYSQRMHLPVIERRIRAGHCTVGAIKRSWSPSVARGAVIRLSARAGSQLPPQAGIAIVLSKGRRPHRRRTGKAAEHRDHQSVR